MTGIEALDKKEFSSINKEYVKRVKNRWDNVSKPLDSMGCFEEITANMGGILKTDRPDADNSIILVFASDNGIVLEGVTQADQSITALCASDIADGKKSVNALAKMYSIPVRVIDVGISNDYASEKVIDRKIRRGSRDFARERALTKDEVIKAIEVGINEVKHCKDAGITLIGLGEMGIGNTTTASAISAALLKLDAKSVTGRGAGLSDEGLARKINIIDDAIKKYDLYNKEPLEVLEAVGGYDIAALAGCCLGGMIYGIPIVLDGFITNAAALAASRLVRSVNEYLIASHNSKEQAAIKIIKDLKLNPVIDANMALGEGCGAVMMIGLIKSALKVLNECLSFEEVKMEKYTHF